VRVVAQLILAFTGGTGGEALSSYQRGRRCCSRSLGVEPSPPCRRRSGTRSASEFPLLDALTPVAAPVPPRFLPRALPDFVRPRTAVEALLAAGDPNAPRSPSSPCCLAPARRPWRCTCAPAQRRVPDGQCSATCTDTTRTSRQQAGRRPGDFAGVGVPSAAVPDGLERRSALWLSVLRERRVLLCSTTPSTAPRSGPAAAGGGSWLALITPGGGWPGLDGARASNSIRCSTRPPWTCMARGLADDRVAAEPDAALATVRYCGNLPRRSASRQSGSPAPVLDGGAWPGAWSGPNGAWPTAHQRPDLSDCSRRPTSAAAGRSGPVLRPGRLPPPVPVRRAICPAGRPGRAATGVLVRKALLRRRRGARARRHPGDEATAPWRPADHHLLAPMPARHSACTACSASSVSN